MKPVLSACTADRCISSKACEQSGPLLGSKKLHTMRHLIKFSPAGKYGFFQEGKKKWLSALPTHLCFVLPSSFIFLSLINH